MKQTPAPKRIFFLPESAKVRIVLMIASIVFLAVVAGGFYLYFAWQKYAQSANDEALQLAHSIKVLLHTEHITAIAADDPTDAPEESAITKNSLVQLVETTDAIFYAYILKPQGENTVIVADSAAGDQNLQPDRQSCEESAKINHYPFTTGESILSPPTSLPCGNFIRVLVPIFDESNETVIAALGLSYSAGEWYANIWKNMTADIVIVAFLLVFLILFFNLRYKHHKLVKTTGKLAFQEALYRNIFEQAPVGIILHYTKEKLVGSDYLGINPMAEEILGASFAEMHNLDWRDMTHPEDLAAELPVFKQFSNGEIRSYSMEKRLIRPDGTTTWININVADIAGNEGMRSMYLCMMEDITERKQSEASLRESERSKSVFFSHLPGMAYRSKFNENWTLEFVSERCFALTGYTAEELLNNQTISYNDIISPEYRAVVRAEWEQALQQRKSYHDEYEIITKSGKRKWVLELGQGIFDENGQLEALEGIILDKSEQKRREHQIVYLREHDFLTGLYNKNHMKQEIKHLDQPEFWPLSVIVCDIDGLRVINDAYSYEEGDQLIVKTAKLMQGALQDEYILGHSGGGKFILLMPQTSSQAAHRMKSHIKNTVDRYNRANENALYAVSISIGHSTKETADQSMADVMKSAEQHLGRRKLLNRNSSHSSIVSAIMATLYAKSQETEQHGQRIGFLCRQIGEKLGLQQNDLDDLTLLSKLHDIGKIGIDDGILNKPGKLSESEWDVMKQHPEIGYRIAIATPQLEHIAEYILHHHERWDGNGYPKGLKGCDIPLASRILAVVDAFDAMTEDRIYRKALPRETAIAEILQHAGTQFDPDIANIIIELAQNNEDQAPAKETHILCH